DGWGRLRPLRYRTGNIGRAMSAGAIEGDEHRERELIQRVTKPFQESSARAAVARQGELKDMPLAVRREVMEDLASVISRAVVNGNHVVGVHRHFTHYLTRLEAFAGPFPDGG